MVIFLNESSVKTIKNIGNHIKQASSKMIKNIKNIKNLLSKPIDSVKINNFLKKNKIKNGSKKDLNESEEILLESKIEKAIKNKPGKLTNADTNVNDTCLTAALKILGKEKLIDKCQGSLLMFLKLYKKAGGEFEKLTKDNIDSLKKGHIILANFDPKKLKSPTAKKVTTGFDPKYGVMSSNVWHGPSGHIMIVIKPDNENTLFLHNTMNSNVNDAVIDHALSLEIYKGTTFIKNIKNEKQSAYVLDSKVIEKM